MSESILSLHGSLSDHHCLLNNEAINKKKYITLKKLFAIVSFSDINHFFTSSHSTNEITIKIQKPTKYRNIEGIA